VRDGSFEATQQGRTYRAPDLDSLRWVMRHPDAAYDRSAFLWDIHQVERERFFSAPVSMLGIVDGHRIFYSRQKFFGIDERVVREPLVGHEQLVQWARDGRGIEAQTANEIHEECRSTLVAHSVNGANILKFRRKYYVLRQSLGPVDLLEAQPDWVEKQCELGLMAVTETVDDALGAARTLAERSGESTFVRSPMNEANGCRIVHFEERYYVLAPRVAHVDLSQSSQEWVRQRIIDGGLAITTSLGGAVAAASVVGSPARAEAELWFVKTDDRGRVPGAVTTAGATAAIP
jgi:hypothetical protein